MEEESNKQPSPFDCIVVTAPTIRSAKAYQKELDYRFCHRFDHPIVVLAVSDPEGRRVGSGGGTLNGLDALIHILRQQGRSLDNVRVVMIHSGGDSQRSPTNSVCGKAWSALNSVNEGGFHPFCNTPIDLLVIELCRLFSTIPPGSLVVASSDVMIMLPEVPSLDWASQAGVTGLAILADLNIGPNHGVYVVDDTNRVTLYLQKVPAVDLQARGAVNAHQEVLIDTGVCYFSPPATKALACLLEREPFGGCTCRGVSQGAPPLRLELYSDILLALSHGVGQSREEFLRMDGGNPSPSLLQARQTLWDLLSSMPFFAITSPSARFAHLGTTEELMQMISFKMPAFAKAYNLTPHACSVIEPSCCETGEAYVINSILEGTGNLSQGALVEHSYLRGSWSVSEGALISGLYFQGHSIQVQPHVCIQEVRLGLNLPLPPSPPPSTSGRRVSFSLNEAPLPSWGIPDQPYVLTVLQVHDPIKAHYQSPEARVCGVSWPEVFSLTGLIAEDIWPSSLPDKSRVLWHARLFPVLIPAIDSTDLALFLQDLHKGSPPPPPPPPQVVDRWRSSTRLSLSDILAQAEPLTELQWRRRLESQVVIMQQSNSNEVDQIAHVGRYLQKAIDQPLPSLDDQDATDPRYRPLVEYYSSIPERRRDQLALGLEDWATCTALTLSQLARLYSLLAQLLRDAAGPGTAENVGHRHSHTAFHAELEEKSNSGGSEHDPKWVAVLESLLSSSHPIEGFDTRRLSGKLKTLRREGALATSHAKGAMHYELAAHRIIRRQVATVREVVAAQPGPPLKLGQVVSAEAPARVGLGGGWSDTPPISYEIGGEVCNMGVKMDGLRPMGARAWLIPEPMVVLQVHQYRVGMTETVCREVSDLHDYMDPKAPAALLKCAIIYSGLVRLAANKSLADQLQSHLGGGFCLESWSNLPTGSGLGTSSILVGTVLGVVRRVQGGHYDENALNHAVLELEQLMSTGGGWQDQVGGLTPGVKMIHSPQGLPLRVTQHPLNLSPAFTHKLNEHMVLIWTGKQRLARDLLRNVLRRYYSYADQVLQTITDLRVNAREAARAVEEGDLEHLGICVDNYWHQKVVMAGGVAVCEPPHVTSIMTRLRPYVHGLTLCGAGGGGFIFAITKEPAKSLWDELTSQVQQCLKEALGEDEVSPDTQLLYEVTLDTEGMVTTVSELGTTVTTRPRNG